MASPAQAKGFARLYATFLGMDPRVLFEDGTETQSVLTAKEEIEFVNPEISAKKTNAKPTNKFAAKKKPIPETANPRQRFRDLIPNDQELKQSNAIFLEIGEELKKQRESLGLSLSDVERLTKIRELYLYNLEQGEVDELPSTVQGRGILNNYSSVSSA